MLLTPCLSWTASSNMIQTGCFLKQEYEFKASLSYSFPKCDDICLSCQHWEVEAGGPEVQGQPGIHGEKHFFKSQITKSQEVIALDYALF